MPRVVGVVLGGKDWLNSVINRCMFDSSLSGVSRVREGFFFLRGYYHSVVEKPFFEKCEVLL